VRMKVHERVANGPIQRERLRGPKLLLTFSNMNKEGEATGLAWWKVQ
jgi:hypothetical protein